MTTIRPEQPADIDAIREVVVAFTGHPVSQGTEPLIIDALRNDGALELSLVAEADGEVVGHIAFSPGGIGEESSGWFVVGPVAVLPDFQGTGIGRKLIEAGLRTMDEYVLCLPFADQEPVGEIAYHPAFLVGT